MQKEILQCSSRDKRKLRASLIFSLFLGLFIFLTAGFILMRGQMTGRNLGYAPARNQMYPAKPQIPADQFFPPQDALKKGELAIIVNDLDAAKGSISQVAQANSGSVYSTSISYATGDIKNGSIVVKVPVDKFETTFAQLKTVGSKLVQESTSEIDKRTYYPQPLAAQEGAVASSNATDNTATSLNENKVAADKAAPTEEQANSSSSIAAPIYAPAQPAQDQGYIKIIFADFGGQQSVANEQRPIASVINYANQNPAKTMLIALVLKVLLLLVLIIFLLIMIVRSLRHMVKPKKLRPAVHVVRQQTKTRARVIKIEKKK